MRSPGQRQMVKFLANYLVEAISEIHHRELLRRREAL
jgi:hypothetical protein